MSTCQTKNFCNLEIDHYKVKTVICGEAIYVVCAPVPIDPPFKLNECVLKCLILALSAALVIIITCRSLL